MRCRGSSASDDNAFAAYKRVRSSAALSGSLPVRITVMLTATHAGPCPNLGDDMRCAIYDARRSCAGSIRPK